MRVCLISPPTADGLSACRTAAAADRWLAERGALGVLTLAAILEKVGMGCDVQHLSRHLFQIGLREQGVDLAVLLAERVAAANFDVLGVSTICSSYPLLLRFAREVKRRRPDCTVVLGGPQATVTDVSTLKEFGGIDAIVRGEADESFPRLLENLSHRPTLALIPGITYRDGSGIRRNPDVPPPLELDALPLPAYHLLPGAHGARSLPLEIGRGCPFSCTFCSTNDYFHRRFRLKSDSVVIAQMTELAARFNVRRFALIHDLFTVNRRRVISFCRALLEAGHPFHWSCSARTDCVDEELLDWMQQAGCTDVFFGVESGSGRIQELIGKKLDIGRARDAVLWCGQRAMSVTAATIVGFPDEEEADVRATLQFVFEAAAQRHVMPQMSFLAPLAGTPIHARYRGLLELDGSLSDFSYQGFRQRAAELRLIAAHPELFPNFYAVPTRLPRGLLQEICLFVTWVFLHYRWLAIALARELGDPWLLCLRWIACRPPSGRSEGLFDYYSSAEFLSDFVRFAGTIAGSMEARVLTSVYSRISELERSPILASRPRTAISVDSCLGIPPSVAVFRVAADPEAVVDALVSGQPLSRKKRRPVTVAWRRGQHGGRLLRLSAPTAHLLSLCNAKHKAYVIASAMASKFGGPSERYDPVVGWIVAMEHLRRRGLVETATAVSAAG